jgi:hypothetical protein
MRKALGFSVIACVLLAGCAAMYPRMEKPAKMQECDSGNACVIAVNVACTRFYGCKLSVDYDLILVKDRGHRTNIVWRLTGETAARFPTDGIVLGSSEFECAPKPESREFTCTDKHADFGVFKYRINVTVPDSPFGARGAPSLDPWVVNN